MFKYNWRRWGRSRYVDESRGVEFRQMGGAGGITNEMGGALYWGDRVIPVRYISFPKRDSDTGASYEQYVILAIGPASTPNQRDAGIVSYVFAGEEEKREAELLAAEAILVTCYPEASGPWIMGPHRFLLHDREWIPRDFGYTSSADVKDETL